MTRDWRRAAEWNTKAVIYHVSDPSLVGQTLLCACNRCKRPPTAVSVAVGCLEGHAKNPGLWRGGSYRGALAILSGGASCSLTGWRYDDGVLFPFPVRDLLGCNAARIDFEVPACSASVFVSMSGVCVVWPHGTGVLIPVALNMFCRRIEVMWDATLRTIRV